MIVLILKNEKFHYTLINYMGITLLDVTYKVFAFTEMPIGEYQAGLTPSQSVLKETQDMCREYV